MPRRPSTTTRSSFSPPSAPGTAAQLTVHEPSQNVYGIRAGLAAQLGIEPSQIRVLSPFVGGAFGSKGGLTQRTAIVAIAARKLGRPVKLVPTREQGFTVATFRAETKHRIKLGATRDGKLQALSHDGFEVTSRPDPYAVAGTDASTRMYACPNIASNVTIVRADRSTPGFMRAPAETPYFFALESAMDELAVALAMDPVELQARQRHDHAGAHQGPALSRAAASCPASTSAAEAFGWSKRDPRPGSLRDGDWLVGWGCATSAYPTQMAAAAARVSAVPRRHGPGRDGRPRDRQRALHRGWRRPRPSGSACRSGSVSVLLGDTDLPPAPVAGGSISTASVCSVDGPGLRRHQGEASSDGGAPTPTDVVAALKDRGMGSVQEYAEWAPHGAPKGALGLLYQRQGAQPTGVGPSCRTASSSPSGRSSWKSAMHAQHARDPRAPHRRRLRVRPHHERPHGPEPVHGRDDLGHRLGAARGDRDRHQRAARYVNTNLADYLVPVNADVVRRRGDHAARGGQRW